MRASLGRALLDARGRSVELATLPERRSSVWVQRLNSDEPERSKAIAELHELLLRAATFEVSRRRAAFPHLRGGDFADVAQQSADDALVAILRKLDDFRGESRFETWAYKFALYEAAANIRKLGWQGREIPLSVDEWPVVTDQRARPDQDAEMTDLLLALRHEIEHELSPHQREVLIALALNGVPIDVLAERLNTTRGALYKTLHDARQKLRRALAARGFEEEM